MAGGIFSGQNHYFSVGNKHADGGISSKREKGNSGVNESMGSQQIPALITTHGRLGSVRGSK